MATALRLVETWTETSNTEVDDLLEEGQPLSNAEIRLNQYHAQVAEAERLSKLNPYDRDYAIQSQPFWPHGYDL